MKIAIITDLHFGARNDNVAFSEYFSKFYLEQFFPTLESKGITAVFDLGDTFDRRKYINYNSLQACKEYFFNQIKHRNMHLSMLVGNHDTYFKNTNSINSPNLLLREFKDCITIYSEAQDINLPSGVKIAMVPWICSGNYNETMNYIKTTSAQIMMGHLEIAGFEMYRGAICDHGFDRKIFDKFDMVMSGHYHHKSSYGNISYLGAPYEMTWSDWNDPRGFHIFDSDTRELTFIQNKFKMFHKVHYDDSESSLEDIMNIDFNSLNGSMVKVIVRNKNNPYWFDMFINKVESVTPLDLQVVEDNFNLNLEDDSDITENVEDTLTVLNKYTAQFSDKVNVTKLNSFLRDLYHEALSVE